MVQLLLIVVVSFDRLLIMEFELITKDDVIDRRGRKSSYTSNWREVSAYSHLHVDMVIKGLLLSTRQLSETPCQRNLLFIYLFRVFLINCSMIHFKKLNKTLKDKFSLAVRFNLIYVLHEYYILVTESITTRQRFAMDEVVTRKLTSGCIKTIVRVE